jgi:hypothetical protein
MLAAALVLAVASPSPPPPVVVPSAAAARPSGQYGEYRTDLSQSRRWGRAALASVGVIASFGAVVFTQVSRDMGYRACLRALKEPDEDFLEPVLENLGCAIEIRGYGRSLGAMAAMPAMLGFVGATGIVLGRGDVDSGRVRTSESLRRAKVGGGAAIGAFGAALLVSNIIMYSVVTGMEPSPQGLAMQRARFISNDVLLFGMAAGVGFVARARAYENRQRKLGLAPMLSSTTTGVVFSGAF